MGIDWGDEARCTPPHDSHNGRHSAAILDEEVPKGSHNIPRDRVQGHRQTAVFCVVGTTLSWGGNRRKKAVLRHRDPEEGRSQP